MRAARAVAFDFNGTLSHDEPILYAIYRDMFARAGRPLSPSDYYGTLAGLTEKTIIGTWLGVEGAALQRLVDERVERYLELCADGTTVSESTREAVAHAAEHVPVVVVSGAFRREIEPVLAGAGLDRHVRAIVAADDVERGKPDPAGYLRALELIGDGVLPQEVVAVEDTEAGVSSAKAAGLYCVAVLGTHAPKRLRDADELVEAIDIGLMRRLLG